MNRIALLGNPRDAGKALKGEWKGYWRFRLGDYPILCGLNDRELIIPALTIGRRKEVYE